MPYALVRPIRDDHEPQPRSSSSLLWGWGQLREQDAITGAGRGGRRGPWRRPGPPLMPSMMSSRMNSASAANTWNTSRPPGVVASKASFSGRNRPGAHLDQEGLGDGHDAHRTHRRQCPRGAVGYRARPAVRLALHLLGGHRHRRVTLVGIAVLVRRARPSRPAACAPNCA